MDLNGVLLWLGGAVVLSGATAAMLSKSLRKAVIFLWISQLGSGVIFLSIRLEYLALLQWLISTLAAALLFHVSLLLYVKRSEVVVEKKKKEIEQVRSFLLTVLGVIFVVFILENFNTLKLFGTFQVTAEGVSLNSLGKVLISRHRVAVEMFAITVLFLMVGSGRMLRSNDIDS